MVGLHAMRTSKAGECGKNDFDYPWNNYPHFPDTNNIYITSNHLWKFYLNFNLNLQRNKVKIFTWSKNSERTDD